MTHKLVKLEISAIYLIATLLVLAIGGLAGKVITAGASSEPYPNLRVMRAGEFVKPQEKTIYFTFDDGPSKNTGKILDILQRQGVKATFFVTAQKAEEPYVPEMLRRIVDEGHSIGLHSYSHDFGKIYKSVDSYLTDLNKLNNYLFETIEIQPDILRFPGGSATANAKTGTMKEIIREITERGYLFYDWNVVSGDDSATVYNAQYLAERMVNGAKGLDSVVILLHDCPAPVTTPEAVDIAIDRFREMGYSFDCLTRYVEPVHIKSKRLE